MLKNIKILTALGLSEKQAIVYLSLHQLGKATAYKVAQHSNLKRPTVYVLLEELRQLDLVLKIPHIKNQIFAAKSLDAFIEHKESAVQLGQDLADNLKSTEAAVHSPVLYYDGLFGVEQAIYYRLADLNGGRSSAILGHLSDDTLLPFFDTWHEKASAYPNFTFRALVSGSQLKKHFSSLQTYSTDGGYITTRTLPNTLLPKDFSFEVFDRSEKSEFLRIVADKDLQATIIETPAVTAAFLQLFNSLWNQAEEVNW